MSYEKIYAAAADDVGPGVSAEDFADMDQVVRDHISAKAEAARVPYPR